MQYCFTNSQRSGTLCFEFQRGEFNGVYWQDTSIYLYADDFDRLSLFKIFTREFNYYGHTTMTASKWRQIYLSAQKIGGETKKVIDEIDLWAQDCFNSEPVFTILGI